MKILLSFATSEYAGRRARLVESARPFFDKRISAGPQNIPAEFRRANAKIFACRRGFGFWSWKPLLILRELEAMGPDDVLMYADSQCIVESDPSPLFELVRRHDGIGLFHQKREGHKNSTWTRGDCFRLMGCDEPQYWDGDNLATTYSVWAKTERSLAFVREWLQWCCNYQIVSDEPSDTPNAVDFKDHRHDQSVASLLAIKYGLFTCCDCSQFGDGYRCPECRYPRILKVDRKVLAPWLRRPTMSSIIEVSTAAACPLRCSYCPQDALAQAYAGPKLLTLEVFAHCLDHLSIGDAIYFAGFAEPCINPDIVPMLEMCLGRGHRTQLYTTGRGLDVERARTIAGMDLERIVLHLPDAAGHLGHADSNVAVLDALAGHPCVEVIAMGNAPHAAVGHLWNRLKINYGTMHNRAGNLEGYADVVSRPRLAGPIRCGAAPQLDHSVVLPDGRVALCCMDYALTNIVGDLSCDSYADILPGAMIADVMARQQDGRDCLCRQCVCAVPNP